jgi:hypothetical protein
MTRALYVQSFCREEKNLSALLPRIASPTGGLKRDKTMNRKKAALAIFLLGLLILLSAPLLAVEVGHKAPDFELPTTKGGKLKLSSLRGRNVLINFYLIDYSPT